MTSNKRRSVSTRRRRRKTIHKSKPIVRFAKRVERIPYHKNEKETSKIIVRHFQKYKRPTTRKEAKIHRKVIEKEAATIIQNSMRCYMARVKATKRSVTLALDGNWAILTEIQRPRRFIKNLERTPNCRIKLGKDHKGFLSSLKLGKKEKKIVSYNKELVRITEEIPNDLRAFLKRHKMSKHYSKFLKHRVRTTSRARKLSEKELFAKIGLRDRAERKAFIQGLEKERIDADESPTEGAWRCSSCHRYNGPHLRHTPEQRCHICGKHRPRVSSSKSKDPKKSVRECDLCGSKYWKKMSKCKVCNSKLEKHKSSSSSSSSSTSSNDIKRLVKKRFGDLDKDDYTKKASCPLCFETISYKDERCKSCRKVLTVTDFADGFEEKKKKEKEKKRLAKKHYWKCDICDFINRDRNKYCDCCHRSMHSHKLDKRYRKDRKHRSASPPRRHLSNHRGRTSKARSLSPKRSASYNGRNRSTRKSSRVRSFEPTSKKYSRTFTGRSYSPARNKKTVSWRVNSAQDRRSKRRNSTTFSFRRSFAMR